MVSCSRRIHTWARAQGVRAAFSREISAPASSPESERQAMVQARIDRTTNRSVLGTMNKFILPMESGPTRGTWGDLPGRAALLNRTPLSLLRYEHPSDAARQLLGVVRSTNQTLTAADPPRAFEAHPSIYELRVSFREVRPEVWRVLRVRSEVTLSKLHRIPQTARGWTDRNLHQFRFGDRVYGRPEAAPPAGLDERKGTLAELLRARGDCLIYDYNLGDGWQHDLELEHALELDRETG